MKKPTLHIIFFIAISAMLSACGGGSSSSNSSTLSGTAATGASLSGATVNVYDSRGSLVATAITDANGKYDVSVGSQYVAPFTIEVYGNSGDGATKLYSLAPSTGTANINQVTNAIAASMSSDGNPASLISGTSVTSAAINNADSAYSAALVNLKDAIGVSGSFISGTFNSAYDKLLDNLQIDVRPGTGIVMTTSTGMQSATSDLAAGATATAAYTSAVFPSTSLPSASNASSLPAMSANKLLSITDLEYLRNKLETCFAIPSSQRGTPSAPAAQCAGLDSPDNNYLHAGNYWLDTTSGQSCTSVSAYCLGLLGYMLSQSTYDNLKFGQPVIVRPLDTNGDEWMVKFPIEFSDGTSDSFGDAVGSGYAVIKKYTSRSTGSSDPGWRFYGDQRVVNSYIEANAQRIQNVFTGGTRYESGLNIHINGGRLRAKNGAHVTKVTVTDLSSSNPVLPLAGITLYKKGSGTGANWRNDCSGFVPLSQSSTPGVCSGVLRLASKQTGSYGVTNLSDSIIANWLGSRGTATIDGNSGYLTDAQIDTILPGQPFNFKIEFSDSTILNFVNRIQTSPVNTAGIDKVIYPIFAAETINAMKTYTGATSFNVNWEPIIGSRPFSSAIYWSSGSYSSGVSLKGDNITSKSVTIPCSGAGANGCANSANWSSAGSPPSKGIAQIRSRQGNGFNIYSQIRQY